MPLSHELDEMAMVCQVHVSFAEVQKRRLRLLVRQSHPPAIAQMQNYLSRLILVETVIGVNSYVTLY